MSRILFSKLIYFVLAFTLSVGAIGAINDSAFLINTDEVQLNEPKLISLAQSLDNDPVKIYNWIYNNIEISHDEGARKNALTVYQTRKGNAWDQSTLLISLYRISSIPARYVYSSELSSMAAFNKVFVEAKLSLNQVRGFGGNEKRWLQLMPWFKFNTYSAGTNYFDNDSRKFIYKDNIDFDLNDTTNGYLSKIRKESAWETYKSKLSDYLQTQNSSLKQGMIITQRLERTGNVLPLSLPKNFKPGDSLSYSGNIPNAIKTKITIYLDEMNANNTVSKNLLSHDVYLSQISGNILSIDFKPSDELYSGILADTDNLSVYPVLKLGNTQLASGSSTNTNKRYRYSYKVTDNDKVTRLTRNVGSFEVLSFDHSSASHRYIAQLKEELNKLPLSKLADWRTRGEYLGRYLQILSYQYLLRYKQIKDDMSAILNIRHFFHRHGTFSINMYTNFLAKDLNYINNHYSQEKYLIHPSINIDARLQGNVNYNFATGQDLLFAGLFKELASYSTSYQEGLIFEDWQSTSSGSTIHALMYASEDPNNEISATTTTDSNGVAIRTFEPKNYPVSYGGLNITAAKISLSDAFMSFSYSSDNNGTNNGGSTGSEVKSKSENWVSTTPGNTYVDNQGNLSNAVIDYVNSDGELNTNTDDSYASEVYSEGDPVDMFSGEFYQQEKADLVFKTASNLDFSIKRTYRSQSDYNGIFGYGWNWNHMERLFLNNDGSLLYFSNDGRSTKIALKSGKYILAPGVTFSFQKIGNKYIVKEKNGFKRIFNNTGLLVKKDDGFGNLINFTYNNNIKLTKITDNLNRVFNFTYNAYGKVISITDSLGRNVNYQYHNNGNTHGTKDDLKAFENLLNNFTRYEYIVNSDGNINNHNMSKYTLPTSEQDYLELHYYKNDKISHHRNSKGEQFNFQYSVKNRYSEIWDERGYYKKLFYNNQGDLIRTDNQNTTVELMSYDDNHNVISHTDGNGNKTTYTYDNERNLLTKTNALNELTRYTYTTKDYENKALSNKKLATITTPDGGVTSHSYYRTGKLKTTTEPNDNLINLTYDNNGNILTKTYNNPTDSDYKIINYTYGANGVNLIKQVLDGITTEYQYDLEGNKTSSTDANGIVTQYQYNPFNQIIETTNGLGHTTQYTYNANQQRTSTTLPNGAVFNSIYDSARDIVTKGLILAKTDPYGNQQTFTYDQSGNRTSQTDANGNTTHFKYNGMNQLVETIDAQHHSTYYKYDGANNLIEEKSSYINTESKRVYTYITYTYDALNRLAKKGTINNNLVIEYSYDSLSRLTQEQHKVFSYASEQAVFSAIWTRVVKLKKTYQYQDNLTQPTQINIYSYAYTDNPGHTQTQQYRYDKLGRKTRFTNATGAITTYTYTSNSNNIATQSTSFNSTTLNDRYTYNNTGKLQSHTNANGRTTTHHYDTLGRRTSTVDNNNNTTTYTYNSVGNRIQQTSALGHTTHYEYNLLGKPTKQIDANGFSHKYRYDANSNLIAQTNANGFTRFISYDSLNRKTAQTDDNNRQYTYEYDERSNLISETNALGLTTYYKYDINNNNIQTRQEQGNRVITINRRYNSSNRLVGLADANGNTTTFEYLNIYNHASHATNALGNTTEYQYNPLGKLTKTIRADGILETQQYDAIGRLITTIKDEANTNIQSHSSYQYDNIGNLTTQIDKINGSNSITHTKTYTPMSQLSSSSIGGITTYFNYDKDNRLKSQTDGNGNTQHFAYDALGKRTQITDASNNTQHFAYDAMGNLITSTSASGIQTHKYYDDYQNLIHLSQGNTHHYYQYDNANRLTQTTDALGNISTQDYDNFGNIISTTQALGTSAEVTTYFNYDNNHNLTYNNGDSTYRAYNALNQMISNKETTYTYDTNGNLATLTQPNGTQISYTYDSLNRKTQTKVNDTLAQTFSYDKLSRMTRTTDYNPQQQDSNIQQKTNTIAYRYNALSQVTNETQNGKSVSVSYNNNQNPTRIRYNAQLTINKSYNHYNRLSTIEYQNNNIVNFNYNADKQIQSQTLANELTASFNYDNNARLIEKNYNNLFTQEIDYDNNNNIIQEQVNLGTTQQIKSYTYDAQDRLTKDNFLAQYFTYDAIGNLTTTNQNNQAESRQTNVNNEYTNITYTNPSTNTQTPVNISYNSNGNLSTYQNKTYTYDYLNRLINIKNNINQPIASYTYDAQNRRVSKTVYTPTNNNNTTTNTTTYLYNQNQVIAQYQNTNTQPSVSFIYSDNTDEPMALIKDQKIYYYLKNHLGSIIALTDNTRLLEIYEYNAFGKLTIKDHNQNIILKSNYNNPYTYTGRRFDNESGLYYYRNRYYQPSLARFISQDPKGYIDGYNLYAYAKNNPLKYTDPFGTTAQQTNYDYQEEWNNWDNDDNWDNLGDISYWDDGDDNNGNGNSQNNLSATPATDIDDWRSGVSNSVAPITNAPPMESGSSGNHLVGSQENSYFGLNTDSNLGASGTAKDTVPVFSKSNLSKYIQISQEKFKQDKWKRVTGNYFNTNKVVTIDSRKIAVVLNSTAFPPTFQQRISVEALVLHRDTVQTSVAYPGFFKRKDWRFTGSNFPRSIIYQAPKDSRWRISSPRQAHQHNNISQSWFNVYVPK